MPRFHIIWGTYGSWLPGDPRGFRTRHHRQHVDGDYRSPPPAGRYAGLHAHARRSLKQSEVVIPSDLREVVGRRCLERFVEEGVTVAALSVGGCHVHVAIVCPGDGLKQLVGRVKKTSSHRVRDRLPGRVWQAGCKVVPVRSDHHWDEVLRYIADHAPQAWVWLAITLGVERS